MERVKTSLWVDRDVDDTFRFIAEQEDRPKARVIRQALQEWSEKYLDRGIEPIKRIKHEGTVT